MYKSRWQIEIFFKWVKQNLKIKSFPGTSKIAVMIQIWLAMIYYLLLSFIKFQTKCRHSLHELTRIISEVLFDSVHLIEILNITFEKFKILNKSPVQISLLISLPDSYDSHTFCKPYWNVPSCGKLYTSPMMRWITPCFGC